MQLSTMTNIFRHVPNQEKPLDDIECIKRASEVGFKVFDLNVTEIGKSGSRICDDDWEWYVDELTKQSEKLGVVFTQSHIPFKSGTDYRWESKEEEDYYMEITRRAIIATKRIGASRTVIHPMTECIKTEGDIKESIKLNHKFHAQTIEWCFQNNLDVNYENMPQYGAKRRFGATYGDMLSLIDSYNDERIGICWDLGHGHINMFDQTIAIKKIKSHLKMIHVSDNHGTRDEHLIPFLGTINWDNIMRALREAEYKYDLTIEVITSYNYPNVLKDQLASSMYQIGAYLVDLAKK